MGNCGLRYRASLLLLFITSAAAQRIVTIAGLPQNHRAQVDGRIATDAPLGFVYGLLLSRSSGRLILHDESLVERLEPDGTLLALAGASVWLEGSYGRGVPASLLRLSTLRGMAEDSAGRLYLADGGAGAIYRIGADGTASTFATPASPRGLAFDSKGNLYATVTGCQCIQRVTEDGAISTAYSLPRQPFRYFEGLAIDGADNLYVTEYVGDQVLRIAPDGNVTVVAGTGVAGYSGDGGPAAEAQLAGPSGVAVDPAGAVYIADTHNHRVRKVSRDGTITTVAGVGTRGFSGDGGPATAAQLNNPAQVLAASDGTLYIADYGNGRVRRVSAGGSIGTVAGGGHIRSQVSRNGVETAPALDATISSPSAAVMDSAGNLYVAELLQNRVRKITPDGAISTVAAPGILSQFGGPYGLAIDPAGALYVASTDSRVRRIDPGGAITVVAGTGPGTGLIRSQGDGGPATAATLNEPKGLAVDAAGNLYIADTSNSRLRMVDRNGIIRTVAGPGQPGTDYWNAVAIDGQGAIYVARTHSEPTQVWSTVDRAASDGSLTRVAGNGRACKFDNSFTADGQPAVDVGLCIAIGLYFDSRGFLYISEGAYGAVLRMGPDGLITRVAGTNEGAVPGDGGPALEANLGTTGGYYSPAAVALDRAGNLFIAGGNRVREVPATPLALEVSRDRIDFQSAGSQSIAITTNFSERFPYQVRVRTDDGGGWLSANRLSGETGEMLTLTAGPKGLAPGVYHATVTIQLWVANPLSVEIPVTMTAK